MKDLKKITKSDIIFGVFIFILMVAIYHFSKV